MHGIAEAPLDGSIIECVTRSRKRLTTDIAVSLKGLSSEMSLERESFSHEIVVPEEFRKLVKNTFQLTAKKATLSSPSDHLEFVADFLPLRPFQVRALVSHSRASLKTFI